MREFTYYNIKALLFRYLFPIKFSYFKIEISWDISAFNIHKFRAEKLSV